MRSNKRNGHTVIHFAHTTKIWGYLADQEVVLVPAFLVSQLCIWPFMESISQVADALVFSYRAGSGGYLGIGAMVSERTGLFQVDCVGGPQGFTPFTHHPPKLTQMLVYLNEWRPCDQVFVWQAVQHVESCRIAGFEFGRCIILPSGCDGSCWQFGHVSSLGPPKSPERLQRSSAAMLQKDTKSSWRPHSTKAALSDFHDNWILVILQLIEQTCRKTYDICDIWYTWYKASWSISWHASLCQEMLGRLFVENFDLRRKLRGSQGTLELFGYAKIYSLYNTSRCLWHYFLNATLMPFEKRVLWFLPSSFCIWIFRFAGEHDASQPWTKLGVGEWMESLPAAGNCVTGIATKAELPGRSLHHRWDQIVIDLISFEHFSIHFRWRQGFCKDLVLDEVELVMNVATWRVSVLICPMKDSKRGPSCLGLEPLCHARRFCSFGLLKVANWCKQSLFLLVLTRPQILNSRILKPAGADSDDESLVPSPLQAPARVLEGSGAHTHSGCWIPFRWWKGQPLLWGSIGIFACLNTFRQLLIGRTLEDLQACIKSWNSMSQVSIRWIFDNVSQWTWMTLTLDKASFTRAKAEQRTIISKALNTATSYCGCRLWHVLGVNNFEGRLLPQEVCSWTWTSR